MAKKRIALEDCLFCGSHPCSCEGTVTRSKLMRVTHADPTPDKDTEDASNEEER